MSTQTPMNASQDVSIRDALAAGSLSGLVRVSDLIRLAPRLAERTGEIRYAFQVSKDPEHRIRIAGRVTGQLVLSCDRCLEPLVLGLSSELDVVVVQTDEQANDLDAEDEPLMVENGRVRILDLVEDEVLLSIPMVVSHGPDTGSVRCEIAIRPGSSSASGPFAMLKELNDTHTQ